MIQHRLFGIHRIRKMGWISVIGVFVMGGCSPKALPTKRSFPKRSNQERILEVARSYIGVPYRYGGMDRSGVDCSGLACRVYADAVGIQLPRTADAQAQVGEAVSIQHLQPGDLVFFKEPKGKKISHVGIVSEVGKGEIRFIHASTGRRRVVEDSLMDPHWRSRFVGARRPTAPSKAAAHTDPQEKSKP